MREQQTINPPHDRLIKHGEVSSICGVSRTSLYKLMRENRFPRPVQGITMFNLWSENEVRAWVAACVAGPRTTDDAAMEVA